jgi:cell wall-associated NlpC family hydrolase
MLVYKRLGINLAHFTGLQWQEGVHVGRKVQPGDLVFFHPTVLGPGHVGIYLGGGRFVQAPHTGDVVKISSLRSARYALTYVGAVRPYGP